MIGSPRTTIARARSLLDDAPWRCVRRDRTPDGLADAKLHLPKPLLSSNGVGRAYELRHLRAACWEREGDDKQNRDADPHAGRSVARVLGGARGPGVRRIALAMRGVVRLTP